MIGWDVGRMRGRATTRFEVRLTGWGGVAENQRVGLFGKSSRHAGRVARQNEQCQMGRESCANGGYVAGASQIDDRGRISTPTMKNAVWGERTRQKPGNQNNEVVHQKDDDKREDNQGRRSVATEWGFALYGPCLLPVWSGYGIVRRV